MKKVSVVVPIYNSTKYLDRCLKSLVNQTLQDIEIILINDGSTNTRNLLMYKYLKDNPDKIKIISNHDIRGIAAARNMGIEIANGEYIGFVNCDDYVDLNYFESLYNEAVSNNYPDIVRTSIETKTINIPNSKNNKRGINNLYLDNLDDRKKYIFNEYIDCCNKIYKRDFIKGKEFNEKSRYIDYTFTIPLLVETKSIYSTDSTKYHHNKNNLGKMITDTLKFDKNILEIFDSNDYIINKSKKYDGYNLLEDTLNDIFILNTYKKIEKIMFYDINCVEKITLISYLINLIDIKYGRLEESRIYQELRQSNIHKYICNYIESMTSKALRKNDNDKVAKAYIKNILNNK